MAARGSARLVALLGKPGTGKTGVSESLAREGATIFRLRDFVVPGMPLDRLGWLNDRDVETVLRRSFPGPVSSPLVVEDFPGRAAQVTLLVGALRRAGWNRRRLVAVELTAPDPVVAERIEERRVCRRCDPSPNGPRIAVNGASAGRCGRCGGPTERRPNDREPILTARLARYERNRIPVESAFADLGVPYLTIDATQRPDRVREAVAAVVAAVERPLAEAR